MSHHRIQGQSDAVFIRQQWMGRWPLDRDIRVVPDNSQFIGRIIKVGAFVLHFGDVTHHTETVRETGWYIALEKVIGSELELQPTSEGRRAFANIDYLRRGLSLAKL